MIVYLGPQFVQLINGYLYLRSEGVYSSAAHSGQTEISGETKVLPGLIRLSRMENVLYSLSPSSGTAVTLSMRAMGGGEASRTARNFSREGLLPVRTPSSPWEVLRTQPRIPYCSASRCLRFLGHLGRQDDAVRNDDRSCCKGVGDRIQTGLAGNCIGNRKRSNRQRLCFLRKTVFLYSMQSASSG